MLQRSLRAAGMAALVFFTSVSCVTAQDDIDPARIEALLHKSKAERRRVATEMARQCDELVGSHFVALRELAREADKAVPDRASKQRFRRPSRKPPELEPLVGELPAAWRYVFGRAVVESTETKRAARASTELRVPLELAAQGLLLETDRALAVLLRKLDTDTSADTFAAFLESWRNGDESFYEALDRTAGTESSVFFYDAMLSDFVSDVADQKDAATKELRRDLKVAHDALHDAFLAYRQYRAFREALALSLLLPPGRSLPARLQRYEAEVSGGYSLREQAAMLLHLEGGDPRAVVARVAADAEPLPRPLWSAPYRPSDRWEATFTAAIPRMVEVSGDTDKFLQAAEKAQRERADEVRAIAESLLPPVRGAH